ncbi:hypothetical protein I4F81_009115 [Pyropia yezoensis]|uniref:Uncharacterized protein n=1 Tax=Pyropia yezoensis TaxID=2788 RepID=A0ACC3C8H8_PYRYE|nr:hypothetical protein I4F81_009115 [Neopyropia yezoensis]
MLALPPGAGAAGPWVFALVADMDRHSRRYDRPASAGSPSSKRAADPGAAAASHAAAAAGAAGSPGRVSGSAVSARRANHTGGLGGVGGVPPPPARPAAYAITWFDTGPCSLLWSRVNEDGRGMELSELAMYRGRLYAPDDRTGVLFEVLSPRGGLPHPHGGPTPGRASSVTRRMVLADGDGESATAFKAEWMAVKRGELIIGGHGREVTAPSDGTAVRSTGPL